MLAAVQHTWSNRNELVCDGVLLQADVEAAVYLMMANEMVHNLLPDVSECPIHASSACASN
jgi:hypothetical protein